LPGQALAISSQTTKEELMSVSKENGMLMLMSAAVLVSFLILLSSLKGDRNMVRIILAGVGFVGFSCLYAAMLVAKFKGLNS
jgi:hypothetical protein